MNITKDEILEIVNTMKNDKILKNYIYHDTWVSGSSTTVFPISVDKKGIEVQLWNNPCWEKSKKHHWNIHIRHLYQRMFNGVMKRMIQKYGKFFDRKMSGFWKSDGSCPDTLYFTFKAWLDEGVVFNGNKDVAGWNFM